jgi:hypothetical protein
VRNGLRLAAALVATVFCALAHAAPPALAKPFEKPVALRGTLGEAPVQANLRAKAEFDGGVEGDYFFFGHSQKILLAGEIEGTDVALEESENGTDVSGQWNGTITGDTIAGTWQSADGSVSKPFRVVVVRDAHAGAAPDNKSRSKK